MKDLEHPEIVIHSDSVYAMKCVTIWYFKWKKNGWIASNGKEVQNKDLIESILEIQDRIKEDGKYKIRYKYVKAHDGDTYNEMADRIAHKYASIKEEDI
jgi:ribonuclease HI